MKKIMGILLAFILAISLGIVPVSAAADQGNGNALVFSKLGIAQVQGQDVIVDVVVVVSPGKNPSEVALEALQQQGARPFESASLGSEGFTVTGLFWDNNPIPPVVQNYNPTDEPASLNGDGDLALINTHSTWSNVATSSFEIDFGGITDRYPSLVRGNGPQYFDGYNDVAWAKLGGNTLGVTWYSATTDEADMALNTRYPWSLDGISGYDVETVFLHENGHVVGLGHSDDLAAVMYRSYHGAQKYLGDDDAEGITYLYDSNITGSVSGVVTDSNSEPVGGALVVLAGTSLQDVTESDGSYTISNIPDPVTYDVTASKEGESSTILRQEVDGAVAGVNFTLVVAGGGGAEPAPVINSISPNNTSPGDRLTVTISGSNFQNGATVDFGQRITVQNVIFIDSGHLEVQIKVHRRATPGLRDVTVTNPDDQSGTKADGFTVN